MRYAIRRVLYIGSGDTPREDKMSIYVDRARGFLGVSRDHRPLPSWLTEADIDVFATSTPAPDFAAG